MVDSGQVINPWVSPIVIRVLDQCDPRVPAAIKKSIDPIEIDNFAILFCATRDCMLLCDIF